MQIAVIGLCEKADFYTVGRIRTMARGEMHNVCGIIHVNGSQRADGSV